MQGNLFWGLQPGKAQSRLAYDQEMPQSRTTDQVTHREKVANNNKNMALRIPQKKQPALSSPAE